MTVMMHEYLSTIIRGSVGVASSVTAFGMPHVLAMEAWLRVGTLLLGMCVSMSMLISLIYTILRKRHEWSQLMDHQKQKQPNGAVVND